MNDTDLKWIKSRIPYEDYVFIEENHENIVKILNESQEHTMRLVAVRFMSDRSRIKLVLRTLSRVKFQNIEKCSIDCLSLIRKWEKDNTQYDAVKKAMRRTLAALKPYAERRDSSRDAYAKYSELMAIYLAARSIKQPIYAINAIIAANAAIYSGYPIDLICEANKEVSKSKIREKRDTIEICRSQICGEV